MTAGSWAGIELYMSLDGAGSLAYEFIGDFSEANRGWFLIYDQSGDAMDNWCYNEIYRSDGPQTAYCPIHHASDIRIEILFFVESNEDPNVSERLYIDHIIFAKCRSEDAFSMCEHWNGHILEDYSSEGISLHHELPPMFISPRDNITEVVPT